ncbi:kirola-like [Hevea brasiliensis]|uniref:kirola-like n=1 Tax=Hevea brasiliensis TaxID=3981 RepID=UPI0025F1A87B|nr:kirola-like [Hevea brasiliensis]
MALKVKLETEVEVKVPADKAFSIFRSQIHQFPNIASHIVHKAEIHEEGNVLSLKEMVEKIDEENKSITYKVADGDGLKLYKSMKVTIQATAKNDGNSFLKYIIDYEKVKENAPDPHPYLEFGARVIKQVETHLLKA